MPLHPKDLAQVRLNNALALFDEFVRHTARHADAATLRGLEGRFAERLQIQPSYWSQIKGRSRQIGERLARQFEQTCKKPVGWMDLPHDEDDALRPTVAGVSAAATLGATQSATAADDNLPRDADERFIVGLVLTFYRRHPERAKTRLLDLLGEVLTPPTAGKPLVAAPLAGRPQALAKAGAAPRAADDDALSLWQHTRSGIAPLKRKK